MYLTILYIIKNKLSNKNIIKKSIFLNDMFVIISVINKCKKGISY